MIIYYTHGYTNSSGESHRLLERAIAEYLAEQDQSAACNGRHEGIKGHNSARLREDRSDSYEVRKAHELVASMRTTGEFGKPYIPGFAPFSISHSGNTWAVLILDCPENAENSSKEAPGTEEISDEHGSACEMPGYSCGLDVQYGRKVNHLSVANRFFAEEDASIIRETADRDVPETSAADRERALNDVFFRLWARREALIKAIGGSVASTDIPSVSGDTAEYIDVTYRIMDVEIPEERSEFPGPDDSDTETTGRFYAAVCFTAVAEDTMLPWNVHAPALEMNMLK